MKLGIDMDGVLADFIKSFNELVKVHFGIVLPDPAETWDYHKALMTSAQRNKAWDIMKTTPFYGTILPLDGAIDAIDRLNRLTYKGNEVYFITSRPGAMTKFYSEKWLQFHGMDMPTVLLSSNKGPVAKGLGLDVFVDDKPENNMEVLDAVGRDPKVRVYLPDHPYNQWADQPSNYGVRVTGLNEVLDIEFPQKRKAA
jgi:5'(3')-deoxyribonucleotidase